VICSTLTVVAIALLPGLCSDGVWQLQC